MGKGLRMRFIKLRRDCETPIILHETADEIVSYMHTLNNGMVAWNIERQRLQRAGEPMPLAESITAGYALANRETERYINSEILRVKAEVKGLRWC